MEAQAQPSPQWVGQSLSKAVPLQNTPGLYFGQSVSAMISQTGGQSPGAVRNSRHASPPRAASRADRSPVRAAQLQLQQSLDWSPQRKTVPHVPFVNHGENQRDDRRDIDHGSHNHVFYDRNSKSLTASQVAESMSMPEQFPTAHSISCSTVVTMSSAAKGLKTVATLRQQGDFKTDATLRQKGEVWKESLRRSQSDATLGHPQRRKRSKSPTSPLRDASGTSEEDCLVQRGRGPFTRLTRSPSRNSRSPERNAELQTKRPIKIVTRNHVCDAQDSPVKKSSSPPYAALQHNLPQGHADFSRNMVPPAVASYEVLGQSMAKFAGDISSRWNSKTAEPQHLQATRVGFDRQDGLPGLRDTRILSPPKLHHVQDISMSDDDLSMQAPTVRMQGEVRGRWAIKTGAPQHLHRALCADEVKVHDGASQRWAARMGTSFKISPRNVTSKLADVETGMLQDADNSVEEGDGLSVQALIYRLQAQGNAISDLRAALGQRIHGSNTSKEKILRECFARSSLASTTRLQGALSEDEVDRKVLTRECVAQRSLKNTARMQGAVSEDENDRKAMTRDCFSQHNLENTAARSQGAVSEDEADRKTQHSLENTACFQGAASEDEAVMPMKQDSGNDWNDISELQGNNVIASTTRSLQSAQLEKLQGKESNDPGAGVAVGVSTVGTPLAEALALLRTGAGVVAPPTLALLRTGAGAFVGDASAGARTHSSKSAGDTHDLDCKVVEGSVDKSILDQGNLVSSSPCFSEGGCITGQKEPPEKPAKDSPKVIDQKIDAGVVGLGTTDESLASDAKKPRGPVHERWCLTRPDSAVNASTSINLTKRSASNEMKAHTVEAKVRLQPKPRPAPSTTGFTATPSTGPGACISIPLRPADHFDDPYGLGPGLLRWLGCDGLCESKRSETPNPGVFRAPRRPRLRRSVSGTRGGWRL